MTFVFVATGFMNFNAESSCQEGYDFVLESDGKDKESFNYQIKEKNIEWYDS